MCVCLRVSFILCIYILQLCINIGIHIYIYNYNIYIYISISLSLSVCVHIYIYIFICITNHQYVNNLDNQMRTHIAITCPYFPWFMAQRQDSWEDIQAGIRHRSMAGNTPWGKSRPKQWQIQIRRLGTMPGLGERRTRPWPHHETLFFWVGSGPWF